ncbi:MAG: HupE/UreJ family protein [Colwellia sp.]|nr:HupE/UreJ family protein [Colwellia sp.]
MPVVFRHLTKLLLVIVFFALSFTTFAHTVDEDTKQFLLQSSGIQIIPFLYIGADHMVTGYDHLLFLVGVIFFLFKTKDILLYVSLFTLGHSVTLLFGVLNNIQVNAYLIDAIIGFSVIYKGFDNLGGFQKVFNITPNNKIAVLIFGLFHGFGLATKLQELQLKEEGLLENLLAFNVGIEIGQFLALGLILLVISYWRNHKSFQRFSVTTNTLLMSSGMMLMTYQLTGYFIN